MALLGPVKHRARYTVKSSGKGAMFKGCSAGIDLSAVGLDRTRREWVGRAEAVTGDLLAL